MIVRFAFPALLATEVPFQLLHLKAVARHEGWELCANESVCIIRAGFQAFADFLGFVFSKDVFYDTCNDRRKKKMDLDKGNVLQEEVGAQSKEMERKVT